MAEGIKIKPPIAIVQIKRHGKWWNTLWIGENGEPQGTVLFARELGRVTGVRVRKPSA